MTFSSYDCAFGDVKGSDRIDTAIFKIFLFHFLSSSSSDTHSLVGLLTEHCADFFDCFVLGFGDLLPREPAEEGKKSGEDQEHIWSSHVLYEERSKCKNRNPKRLA